MINWSMMHPCAGGCKSEVGAATSRTGALGGLRALPAALACRHMQKSSTLQVQ
jgi:hypothetical protein